MVPISDLRQIVILEHFSDEMLAKFQPIITAQEYAENEFVFRENMKAERFYMILKGKILLEKQISDTITISLGAIKMGYSFGWSTILGEIPFYMAAKCAENCTILSLRGKDAFALFEKDPAMGYSFMQHLGNIMKNRLDRMQERLIRSLREHPDFKQILQ